MKEELQDKHEDYRYIPHEEWWDLLYTMEVKDNSKIYASNINRPETSKAALINSDSNNSMMFPRNKKARTGVLPSYKQHGTNNLEHHGVQSYCVLRNKLGISERKWKYHIYENSFGKISNQAYIKDGLG